MADDLREYDEDLELADEQAPETSEGDAEPKGPEFVDPDAGQETEESQAGGDEPEPEEPKTEPERMIPYSRFEEEVQARRRLEARMDDLMRVALSRPQEAPSGEQESTSPDLDPDVVAMVKPIVEREMEPLKEVREERELAKKLELGESQMEGFRELWPDVQKEFQALPQELQAEFDTLGGALELARRVKARREAAAAPTPEERESERLEKLERRAHSESTPNSRPSTRRRISAADIMDMSAEDFEKFKAAQLARPGGYDVDPLIR